MTWRSARDAMARESPLIEKMPVPIAEGWGRFRSNRAQTRNSAWSPHAHWFTADRRSVSGFLGLTAGRGGAGEMLP